MRTIGLAKELQHRRCALERKATGEKFLIDPNRG